MTDTIKSAANKYFSDENYNKAITTLVELGVESFYVHSEGHDWFKNTSFCSELASQDAVFNSLFNLNSAEQILYKYFTEGKSSTEFEQKLAQNFPIIFINAVRVTQIYLQPSRLRLLLSLELPHEVKVHKDIWERIARKDADLWNKIKNHIKELSDLSLFEVLSELTIWLENKRFTQPHLLEDQSLGRVYNFFITLYLSEYPPNREIDADKFEEEFVSRYVQKAKSPSKAISELLESISHWVHFYDTILSAYSFDLDITPKAENGIISFCKSPHDYYNWKLGDVRYRLNRLDYLFKGAEIIEQLASSGDLEIPMGNNLQEHELNRQLAIQNFQASSFLEDLKLNTLVFKGKNIPSKQLLDPLIAYSFDSIIRYEQTLRYYIGESDTWLEAYSKLFIASYPAKNFPFLYISRDECLKLNIKGIPDLPVDTIDDIINLFSYGVDNKNEFNRLNINFDVWQKPFIRLGNYLFCPMMFIANNDWFYGFAQVGLNSMDSRPARKVRKETATEMENYLGSLFKEKSWTVKVFTDGEASSINGDVDIAISDRDLTLLIQLKRTKFRLDAKDAYFELINSDRKASKQLNDGEVSLRNRKDLFSLANNVTKWIVSTSFENILSRIDGNLKINYFELLNAGSNPEITRLSELIEYCEADMGVRKWNDAYYHPEIDPITKFGIEESGMGVMPTDPKFIYQDIFLLDYKAINYDTSYSEAIELGSKGNKRKAIKLLESCIEENPNDFKAWGSLGNFYADIKDFDNSFIAFEKTLGIIPNDPYTIRNYALANKEAGNIEKWKTLIKRIENDFWFLNLK